MQSRYFSLGIGAIYLLIGIGGFIPALYTHPAAGAPHVDVTASYGYLFGHFPVNALHDAVHIVIGIAGILCFASFRASVGYAKVLFVAYGGLAVLGFIPMADTLWGLIPIFGSDTWLHAVSAVVASYFGWVAPAETHMPAFEESHA